VCRRLGAYIFLRPGPNMCAIVRVADDKGAAREHDVFEGKYLFVKLNISANVGYFSNNRSALFPQR